MFPWQNFIILEESGLVSFIMKNRNAMRVFNYGERVQFRFPLYIVAVVEKKVPVAQTARDHNEGLKNSEERKLIIARTCVTCIYSKLTIVIYYITHDLQFGVKWMNRRRRLGNNIVICHPLA